MNVPFNDLYAQYLGLKPEIDEAISRVIAESAFIRGAEVERFEQSFREAIGVDHCISCANGTDALYIAMVGLGVKPGDEVITTAHSWISTSETISQAGGVPVFVDTEEDGFCIDVEKIEAKMTSRTVGIIPVHLYGHPAKMDRIMEIARRRGLWVIEDCAQAHLAKQHGRMIGSFGDAATFSFYPGKNLGAMGDAGCLVTNRADLARHAELFARHGGKGVHEIEGINSRLDGLQAAVLNVKLPHLASWTEARRELAHRYSAALREVSGLVVPSERAGSEHVYHLYSVLTEQRDSLRTALNAAGIGTVVNYPVPLPLLPAYKRLGHAAADFPVAVAQTSRVLCLPIFPEMGEERLDRVVAAVKSHFGA
jgi:dTDP-4-amino-4,6-dideoxygalactose transaminase